MITLWDRSNLYFRFPNVLAIPTTPFTHTPQKYLTADNKGTSMKNVMEQFFLTENKRLKKSLAGSIKRTQVVYTALFSCQERRLWKWHAFHRKLMPSIGSCGIPGPALLPEDTQRFWVLFINQGTIICPIIPSKY